MAKAKFINIAFNENLTNPDGFPIYPGQDIWKLPDGQHCDSHYLVENGVYPTSQNEVEVPDKLLKSNK
jgi:hypothetical protein